MPLINIYFQVPRKADEGQFTVRHDPPKVNNRNRNPNGESAAPYQTTPVVRLVLAQSPFAGGDSSVAPNAPTEILDCPLDAELNSGWRQRLQMICCYNVIPRSSAGVATR